jgi:nitroimidazol reductase NimA-like FMN-containing flavoprotein (pyridoxamine 5'-phosphate oxidase superfamily)
VFTDAERAFVEPRPVARVATVQPDGSPHVVPVCLVVAGNRVIFESGAATVKTTNLLVDPRVSICWDEYVDDWDALAQVVAFGHARALAGDERSRAAALLVQTFPQFLTQSTFDEHDLVVEVAIERVSSWGV